MVVLPAHKKADLTKLERVIGEKLELEDPKIIFDKWGLQIGAVPPFGNLLNIRTYIDKGLLENEDVSFNCGLRTALVIMKSADMVPLINGTPGEYSI